MITSILASFVAFFQALPGLEKLVNTLIASFKTTESQQQATTAQKVQTEEAQINQQGRPQ